MFDPDSFYKGFFIDQEVGNNVFSFSDRKNKALYVPDVIKGTPDDLQISEHIAFSEVVDDKELNLPGLKNFIHWHFNNKECFIFDNHNHAFFFWLYALQKGLIRAGIPLVHVDQHTDMRQPEKLLLKEEISDPARVFEYTNYELNVGNFIKPALSLGVFNDVNIIDNSYSFEYDYSPPYVLDVDMDIFSEDMSYIPDDLKVKKITALSQDAQFLTIATSPFFMDQNAAIDKIKEIFLID